MATTKAAQRSSGAQPAGQRTGGSEETPHRRTATVNLPFVTAEFRAPELKLPSMSVRPPNRSDLDGAVSAIRSRLPTPGQAVYYAGLGVLGALELIEWPVVLAIGVGTALVQQQGGAQRTGPEPNGKGIDRAVRR